jgi:hypothetical protein
MKLEPRTVTSQGAIADLVAELQSLHLERKIKLKKGSFSLDTFIDVEFTLNGERWRLHGVNDVRGEVSLDRIS